MKVTVFDVDDACTETLRGVFYLDDVIERDDPEHEIAARYLKDQGRYWGGSAGSLFLIIA